MQGSSCSCGSAPRGVERRPRRRLRRRHSAPPRRSTSLHRGRNPSLSAVGTLRPWLPPERVAGQQLDTRALCPLGGLSTSVASPAQMEMPRVCPWHSTQGQVRPHGRQQSSPWGLAYGHVTRPGSGSYCVTLGLSLLTDPRFPHLSRGRWLWSCLD